MADVIMLFVAVLAVFSFWPTVIHALADLVEEHDFSTFCLWSWLGLFVVVMMVLLPLAVIAMGGPPSSFLLMVGILSAFTFWVFYAVWAIIEAQP